LSLFLKKEGYDTRKPRRRSSRLSCGFIESEDSPIDFEILFYPQYQDENGGVVCYPDSVFEGIVKLKVSEPIPAHHVKLIFKATG
jgi:hypothetical protein